LLSLAGALKPTLRDSFLPPPRQSQTHSGEASSGTIPFEGSSPYPFHPLAFASGIEQAGAAGPFSSCARRLDDLRALLSA
jgi:hypothetical protein